ncbi:hypothetical protein [Pantoea stewartii]|nr:hypothetical protein [Pantoea stewartii]
MIHRRKGHGRVDDNGEHAVHGNLWLVRSDNIDNENAREGGTR